MRSAYLVLPLVAVLGCAHKEQKKDDALAAQAAQRNAASSAAPGSQPMCANDAECGAGQLCIRGQCVNIGQGLAECSEARVHFDFDSADIHPDDKPLMERMSRCLKADHKMHVTIEGNADERGTQDYNLALGDRRATEVARYLELLGVSQKQLRTVSYGKENPLCSEHDEACWSKNRRAALKAKDVAKR